MSLGRFSPNFRANSGLKIVLSGMCFSIFVRPVFGHVFDNFGDDFGDHFGTKSAQEGAKTSPYVHQEFHRPNTLHLQKHKKLYVFLSFWGPEASQKSVRKPKRAPKRHPKTTNKSEKKTKCKLDLSFLNNCWDSFEGNFGARNGSNMYEKLDLFLDRVGPIFANF